MRKAYVCICVISSIFTFYWPNTGLLAMPNMYFLPPVVLYNLPQSEQGLRELLRNTYSTKTNVNGTLASLPGLENVPHTCSSFISMLISALCPHATLQQHHGTFSLIIIPNNLDHTHNSVQVGKHRGNPCLTQQSLSEYTNMGLFWAYSLATQFRFSQRHFPPLRK